MKLGFILKLLLITIVSCLMKIPSWADNSKTGTTAAQFLKIGVGARATAMGGAYGAVCNDVTAVFWNPAGLCLTKEQEISVMHSEWFEGIKYEFLGYSKRFKKFGTLAISGNYLSYGDLTGTREDSATGAYLAGSDYTFTASDFSGAISYAKLFGRFLGIGANFKYIQLKNEDEKATGIASDLGIQYLLYSVKPVLLKKISLSAHNLGSSIEYIAESDVLPRYVRVGAAWGFNKDKLLLGSDVIIPNDNKILLALGMEYTPVDLFSIRGGYRYRLGGDNLNGLSGLTAGIGIKIPDYNIDYAYAPYGDLGDTHRISLRFAFGSKKKFISAKRIRVYSADKEIEILERQIFAKEEREEMELSKSEKKAEMGRHFNRASKLYNEGKYKESIKEWGKVLEIEPNHELSQRKIEKANGKIMQREMEKPENKREIQIEQIKSENKKEDFQTYIVRGGDTLRMIARKLYNNSNDWKVIYEENKNRIKQSDQIYPGQVLTIP